MTRLAGIAAAHVPHPNPLLRAHCDSCGDAWPCDTALLVLVATAAVAREAAEEALETHLTTDSDPPTADEWREWHKTRDRLESDRALAVHALRDALAPLTRPSAEVKP